MNLNYLRYFTISLQHEYFVDRKARQVEIIPASDCIEACRGMNIQLRNTGDQLIAFIRENGEGGPFVNSRESKLFLEFYRTKVLRFYLSVKDPLFYNYTNLEIPGTPAKKFYFSNNAQNFVNGTSYLSQPVPEPEPGKEYKPGDLVSDPATGEVFECTRKNVASKKKGQLNDTGFWVPKGLAHLSKPVEEYATGKTYLPGDLVRKPSTDELYEAVIRHTSEEVQELGDEARWKKQGIGQLQYPTPADLLEHCGDSYLFKLDAPITKADIRILRFNFNAAKPAYDEPALEAEKRVFNTPQSQVIINFSALPAGRYSITVNKETRSVYHDRALQMGNLMGVIEIFNHLRDKDEASLLSAEQMIKGTEFRLQFPNRRVLWRYIRKDGKASRITDSGKTKYAFALSGEDFISTTPIPLAEASLKTLKLEFNTKDFGLQPLPNPRIERLGRVNQDEFDYFCSDVYLNY